MLLWFEIHFDLALENLPITQGLGGCAWQCLGRALIVSTSHGSRKLCASEWGAQCTLGFSTCVLHAVHPLHDAGCSEIEEEVAS